MSSHTHPKLKRQQVLEATRAPYRQQSKHLLQLASMVAAIPIAGVVVFFSSVAVITAISAGVLCIVLFRRVADFFFMLGLIACAGAMLALGFIRFTFFPQALYLLQQGADPWQMVLSFDVWGPRYLLSYPAVLLSRGLDLDLDLAFTVYGLFGMTLIAFLCIRYFDLTNFFKNSPKRRYIAEAIVGGLWLSACVFMNGRLINSFLGVTLVMYAQAYIMSRGRFTIGSFLLQGAGVFLAMMTSGTVMVVFFQMIVGSLLINKTLPPKQRMQKALVLFLVALSSAGLIPFVYEGVLKNRSYFQGSLLLMLTHGLGGVFFVEEGLAVQAEIAFFIVGLALLIWGHRLMRQNPRLLPVFVPLPLGLVLGLFGYSTMLMFLPSIFVLCVYFVLHVEAVAVHKVPQAKENRPWERKILSS